MNRTKRFVSGVITGYGSIAANIVFTIVSIPLALHFLSKEYFGLWALAAQINGYLSLLELGMGVATYRYIADHKDKTNDGEYGSHLLSGGFLFVTQGIIVTTAGIGLSWLAPSLFSIPAHLAEEFRHLLILLAVVSGISISARSVGSPLWAFQRMDVVNTCSALWAAISLAGIWIGLELGWGVKSFAIAQLPAVFALIIIHVWVCRRNGYYPSKNNWGRPNFSIFKRIFILGKDNLLIQLGTQLVNASQIMIISRVIGLEAAAVFAVSTKLYTMGMMLVANPISAAAPGLTELYVRNEESKFIKRFWELLILTICASTLMAACIASGNSAFIDIWTRGSIHWPWMGDLLLAILLVLKNTNGALLNLFGVIKDWRPVRFAHLAEGLVFIATAFLLADLYGLIGILIASLIAHIVTTTFVSIRAASRIIGSFRRIHKSIFISVAVITTGTTLNLLITEHLASSYLALAVSAVLGVCVMALMWRSVLTSEMRLELKQHLAKFCNKIRLIIKFEFTP